MGAKLKVGDTVICRFFNGPERKFYGDYWRGEIVAIDSSKDRPYTVMGFEHFALFDLTRKEIKRRITSKES